jgi:hypothetical protein
MSSARDVYWAGMEAYLPRHDYREALKLFRKAAKLWEDENEFLNASIAMSKASSAAWGNEDTTSECISDEIMLLEKCIAFEPSGSIIGIAARHDLAFLMHRIYPYGPSVDFTSDREKAESLFGEYAQLLLEHFGDQERSESFLVRGYCLDGDLSGPWTPSFIIEARWGMESWGGRFIRRHYPSAFRIFIELGDYAGATSAGDKCPTAFDTPGLKGWFHAAKAFVEQKTAAQHFDAAGAAFSEDTVEAADKRRAVGTGWSSENVHLWAPYFKSRAHLARAIADPEHLTSHMLSAAKEITEPLYWLNPGVASYKILIQALAGLIGDSNVQNPEEARDEFISESRLWRQQPEHPLILTFLRLTADAFAGFKKDPAHEITSGTLAAAISALARIPVIGADLSKNLQPLIGREALKHAVGPISSWIHRTLESIRNEAMLRKIVLRLEQARLPLYAQILHGPIEFGKDIVVLLEVEKVSVLRMYQVKCGDMTKPKWRDSKEELEEMYTVPISAPEALRSAQRHERVLIYNGHANPHVAPVMDGWLRDQQERKREFKIIDIDGIVRWIIKDRLVNELRGALRECKVNVIT